MDKYTKIIEQIKALEADMVDFKIVDFYGRLRHVTIPTTNITEKKLQFGFGFDGSNFGFAETGKSDFVARPVIKDFVELDPCLEDPTATFMCDVYEAAQDVKPYESDPRGILRKACAYMQSLGVADVATWGPELEFYLFNDLLVRTDPQAMSAEIISDEGYWGSQDDDYSFATRLPKKGGYHSVPPNDTQYQTRVEAVRRLTSLGYDVKYHHHEVGGPGQCEVEFNLMDSMVAADCIILGKYIIRNTAQEFGSYASFLPKPIFGEAGNGLHVHFLMKGKNGELVFHDPNGYMGLSKMALSFLAGILTHAPAITAITNPSTNSYKRLVRGYEAPCNCCYGMANRNAAVRIPAYATQPEEKRFEYRVGDATFNPYLALSAILMAGLDGVKKDLNPEGKFGPLEKMDKGWEPPVSIPASLKEALEALQKDHQFLLDGGVFTKGMLEKFISDKMQDHLRIERTPHPVEFEMYELI
ncbi:MAG TPA: type I glutamate--ammonia ligase [Caldisericia bacterium]|nr:type I glutamate--ammonia ligase [Caldisericia bacterium]HOU07878.1 type I glutamate--ammonia ligase [Caldisericia bacterium]HPL90010.1 type I glutamate--ammonia ligase [Caldisericia bacterium]HQG59645.1 type I glutamate--ammonia ligase [Caldisericia bacterium]HQH48887.1 type I glutamate--ammonia ligase [Caldisericia bacterium]